MGLKQQSRSNELTAPFTAAFLLIVLAAAYLDLSTVQIPQINDKALHFMTFFVLTVRMLPDWHRAPTLPTGHRSPFIGLSTLPAAVH
jgi:hypothetical protein